MNPWGITFQQGLFNMTSGSEHFRTEAKLIEDGWSRDGTDWMRDGAAGVERRVPLYEAKMIHHFDHRWATYGGANGGDEEGARDVTSPRSAIPRSSPSPATGCPRTR